MKNILKIFGVITLLVVIGFSMTACPEEEEEPATIIVTNASHMRWDVMEAGVTIALYQGGTKIKDVTGVQTTAETGDTDGVSGTPEVALTFEKKKTSATFSDIEAGEYEVWVTDARPATASQLGNPYKSKAFTFGEGLTITLTYDGESVK
jgi:hypothetical protein